MKVKFNKIFILCLFGLFEMSYIFAYIDPGTGGYLISSLWGWLVGFLALVFGVILRFFKYNVKNFILKYKFISLFGFILILFSGSFGVYYFYFSDNSELGFVLPAYDSELNGVQVYDKVLSSGGYNLYEGKLIDMDGKLVNKWNYSYLSVIDKEGNYYAQKGYESLEWGKFDWNDSPIWIKKMPIHHEIYLTEDGNVITLTKESYKYNGRMVEFDVVVEFDSDGNEVSRWSTYENLEYLKKWHRPLELENSQAVEIDESHKKNLSIWGANYDYYHMNSISIVPDNSKKNIHRAFSKGNWIISFRHGSMIFILDKDTKEVLWTGIYDQIKGNVEGQHAPKMLFNGNILVFDNGRYRGWSRIIEINPINLNIVKEYKNDDFFSYSQGFVQVLNNGNYLITESEDGRVFELSSDFSKIVWEFFESKSVENEKYGLIRDDIYRMTRYDKKFIDKFLFD